MFIFIYLQVNCHLLRRQIVLQQLQQMQLQQLQQELCATWVSKGFRKRLVEKFKATLFCKLKTWWNLWDKSNFPHDQVFMY